MKRLFILLFALSISVVAFTQKVFADGDDYTVTIVPNNAAYGSFYDNLNSEEVVSVSCEVGKDGYSVFVYEDYRNRLLLYWEGHGTEDVYKSISPQPKDGYIFLGWLINGVEVNLSRGKDLSSFGDNIVVTANYVKNTVFLLGSRC